MDNRMGKLIELVNNKLDNLVNYENLKASEHLNNVSILSALLARKRGLNIEICQIAGLLHDLWLYCHFPVTSEQHKLHGENGAKLAYEILNEINEFPEKEVEIICRMIANHNYKDMKHDDYDELLKDADAFAHFLRNSSYDKTYNYHNREKRLLEEFLISV